MTRSKVIPAKSKGVRSEARRAKSKARAEARKTRIVTRQSKANAATEFVSSIFCQRFLRNLTVTITVQFLLITSIIFLILFQPQVGRLTSSHARTIVIVNAASYAFIVLTMIFFNKVYRKAGAFNHIPLLVVTVNIGCLLAIPVLKYRMYEILVVVLAVVVHFLVMTGCQVWSHWELSLPSGIFGIVLGNTVIGTVLLSVSIYGYKRPPPPSYIFLGLQVIITSVCAYILYDVELMTSEPGLHKLYHYKVVYGNHAYAALHVFTDYIRGILTIPQYVYECCKAKFRKAWYSGFVPRSGFGMTCGNKVGRRRGHSDLKVKK